MGPTANLQLPPLHIVVSLPQDARRRPQVRAPAPPPDAGSSVWPHECACRWSRRRRHWRWCGPPAPVAAEERLGLWWGRPFPSPWGSTGLRWGEMHEERGSHGRKMRGERKRVDEAWWNEWIRSLS
jgi:hypothetical protein